MHHKKISVGLRVDVDTYRGTLKGVPKLLDLFQRYDIKATFFFTVGPDNMGRHLWRLFRPAFLKKMLRSNANSLYGYDILLKGTLWKGPHIGKKLGHLIQQTNAAGHEIGLHAWDHHKWQTKVDTLPAHALHQEIELGYSTLQKLIKQPPTCSAVAGWRCNNQTLIEKEKFAFHYNSDCRGDSIFIPDVGQTPQIPVTLPTYDEIIGQNGVTQANYNDTILNLIKSEGLNVYTIHAEAEGIACSELFEAFLLSAHQRNIEFLPLKALLPETTADLPIDRIENIKMEGREGWLSHQASSVQTPFSHLWEKGGDEGI